MLVPSQFDYNRRSVPDTSNDCWVYGLPTFADPVAKDQVAPKNEPARAGGSARLRGNVFDEVKRGSA